LRASQQVRFDLGADPVLLFHETENAEVEQLVQVYCVCWQLDEADFFSLKNRPRVSRALASESIKDQDCTGPP
jgi:hypothetical protein